MNGLMIMLRLKPVLAMQTMALLWADLTWPLHMIKVGLSPFNLSASRPALRRRGFKMGHLKGSKSNFASINCAASLLGSCNVVAETHFDCHALHMWKHGMLYWVVVLHGLFYLCPWLSLAHSKIQPVHTVRCSLFTGPHQLAVCRSHHIPCISHPAGQPHEWQVVP